MTTPPGADRPTPSPEHAARQGDDVPTGSSVDGGAHQAPVDEGPDAGSDAPRTDAPRTDAPLSDAPLSDAPLSDAHLSDVHLSDPLVEDVLDEQTVDGAAPAAEPAAGASHDEQEPSPQHVAPHAPLGDATDLADEPDGLADVEPGAGTPDELRAERAVQDAGEAPSPAAAPAPIGTRWFVPALPGDEQPAAPGAPPDSMPFPDDPETAGRTLPDDAETTDRGWPDDAETTDHGQADVAEPDGPGAAGTAGPLLPAGPDHGEPVDEQPPADAGSDPAPGPRPEDAPGPTPSAASGWAVLGRALRPRATRAQVLAGVLCALLGFALAVQIRQASDTTLSGLRQADLVRLVDEVTTRGDALERERADLAAERDELLSGSDRQQAALDALRRSAETQGILTGRLPAEGPGIVATLVEPDGLIKPVTMLNMLEELRNAGAEAIQLNDQRITASSAFTGVAGAIELDGVTLSAPYVWVAIGDPDTMATALQIPGGALAQVRGNGGRGTVERADLVEVSAIRVVPDPVHATPVPPESE